MDTKTITLEADAYEGLCAALLPGESFSAAVRRMTPVRKRIITGADLRAYIRRGASGLSEEHLDAVEAATKHDPSPTDPWA